MPFRLDGLDAWLVKSQMDVRLSRKTEWWQQIAIQVVKIAWAFF